MGNVLLAPKHLSQDIVKSHLINQKYFQITYASDMINITRIRTDLNLSPSTAI